jgi:phage terminase large subunit GpA-like protein
VNIVQEASRLAWKPADRRAPWKWAEDNFTVAVSPFPGKWRADNSPWVKSFMEDFADNRIQSLSIMCSAQSAKTETMIALLCWLISEDPGPCMWVTSSDEEALKFANERLMPSLRACPSVAAKMPDSPRLTKSREVYFPGMALEVVGSNAPSKLQSKPRRWLLLDEVRNWPPGALPMVLKRTRTFWNARRVVISTPDQQHDAVHQEFLMGDQRHYYSKCEGCNADMLLEWDNLKWNVDEKTKPDGRYDFDVLAKTVRYECAACGHAHKDEPQVRRKLTDGIWKPHNTKCPSNRRSYTWSAMLPPWVRWRDLVEEFLSSKKALSWGDPQPLKTFITETLGQPWEDRLKYGKDAGYLESRRQEYKLLDTWEGEERRFLAADIQKDHMFYVCRAFGQNGTSRLIDCGRISWFDDLRQKIKDLKVDDDDVAIDSGYLATQVYNEVTKSGYAWKPMKGDELENFMVDKVRQIWKDSLIDPALGTTMQGRVRPIRLFHFSNPSIKDLLNEYMHGVGPTWEIPENIQGDYLAQMHAEHREEAVDSYGKIKYRWVNKPRRPNHYFDCECMLVVAGLVTGMLGVKE